MAAIAGRPRGWGRATRCPFAGAAPTESAIAATDVRSVCSVECGIMRRSRLRAGRMSAHHEVRARAKHRRLRLERSGHLDEDFTPTGIVPAIHEIMEHP